MDKLSISGLLIAIFAIGFGYWFEGGLLLSLVNYSAFLIVIGGTLGAVMLQSPVGIFIQGIKMFTWIIKPPKYPVDKGISQIKIWSNKARQEGYLSLEKEALESKDYFVSKGLNMMIDGVAPEQFRETMEVELILHRGALMKSSKIYEAMGGYSPTIGILGAVLGLIQAMNFIKEPELLGAGIAAAFVATIYGVGFANLLFLPVANKLKCIVEEQMMYHELLAEGMLSIIQGESPSNIELKLSAYQTQKHYAQVNSIIKS